MVYPAEITKQTIDEFDADFEKTPKVSLKDIRDLNSWRDVIPEYVKEYVSINIFM